MRWAGWAAALVAGAVYGVAGTIAQAYTWGALPVGIVVAFIGVTSLLVGMRLLTTDRWTALAGGLGVMLATLVFSGRGPGGSVVVPAPVDGALSTGVVWTLLVPIVVAVVTAWPSLPAARGARTN